MLLLIAIGAYLTHESPVAGERMTEAQRDDSAQDAAPLRWIWPMGDATKYADPPHTKNGEDEVGPHPQMVERKVPSRGGDGPRRSSEGPFCGPSQL